MTWDDSPVLDLISRGERFQATRLQAEVASEFFAFNGGISLWERIEFRAVEIHERMKAEDRERSYDYYRRRESVLVAVARAKRVKSARCRCCGAPVPDAHRRGWLRRFCSQECKSRKNHSINAERAKAKRQAARKAALAAATCHVCGGPVTATTNGLPPKYCSRACQCRAYRARRSNDQ
jgi:hypothetical protein